MQYKLIIFALTMALLSGCSSEANVAGVISETEGAVTVKEQRGLDTYSGDIQYENIGTYEPSEAASREEIQLAGDASGQRNVISFTPITNTVHAEDGTTILYESYDAMEFAAQDPELDSWGDSQITQIEALFHDASAELLQQAEEHYQNYRETFYSYSNYLNMSVARHDQRMISILAVSSMYSGGAHPVTIQNAYNLDFAAKKTLHLEDVIEPDSSPKLQKAVIDSLEGRFKQIGNQVLYDNYSETIGALMEYGSMTPNWYLSPDGLVIYFNQYEIAAYAAGVIKVEFPYADLEGILKEEYMPEQPEGECGSLHIIGDPSGYMLTPVTLGTGSRMLIGTECEIQQLQFSEVTQLEGTPISKRVILSMNKMRPDEALEIIGLDQSDSGKSYTVEYQNNASERVIYHIRSGELIEGS